jgi:hypothetical protein
VPRGVSTLTGILQACQAFQFFSIFAAIEFTYENRPLARMDARRKVTSLLTSQKIERVTAGCYISQVQRIQGNG